MKYLLIISVVIFSGCGASHHLKRAKFHIAKAEALGASIEVKSDTIVQFKDVPFPVVKFDTVFNVSHDTVRFTKDSIEYKVLVRNNKVYIHSQSKPRYFRVKETVYVNKTTTIKAGFTAWDIIKWCLFVAVLSVLLSRLLWK